MGENEKMHEGAAASPVPGEAAPTQIGQQATTDASATAQVGLQTEAQPTVTIPAAEPAQQGAPVTIPSAQPAAAQGAPAATQAMPATDATAPASTTAPVAAAAPAVAPTGAQPSATPALVCGILSLVFCGIPIIGIILGIVAIVLAGNYFKAGGTAGTGKAGRICGIVGIALSVIVGIISVVLTMMAFTMLGNQTSSSYTPYSSQSSSSYGALDAADEDEQAVYDVVNARLDQIQNQDPAMMQSLADMLETSFNEAMDDADLGMTVTMDSIGVDPMQLAQLMVEGFTYEPLSVYISSSSPDEAEADYYVTMRTIMDVEDEFLDQVRELSSNVSSMTKDEALTAIGQTLISSVEAVEPDETFFDIDLNLIDGTWTIDEETWDEEIDFLLSFY